MGTSSSNLSSAVQRLPETGPQNNTSQQLSNPNINANSLITLQQQIATVEVGQETSSGNWLIEGIIQIVGGPAGLLISSGLAAIKFAHSILIQGTLKDRKVIAALKNFIPDAYNLQDIVKKLIRVYQTVEGLFHKHLPLSLIPQFRMRQKIIIQEKLYL